jgi:TPR repeat protein
LGICYERGRGVSTDRPEAYKLYKFAAKLDCARAAAYLKGIVSRMTAVEMAQGESRYREFTADYADF